MATRRRTKIRRHPRRLANGRRTVVDAHTRTNNRADLSWKSTDITEGRKAAKATRDARKIVRTGPIDIYRFPNGKWSWAIPSSPIGQQLRLSGEIYPGTKADKWFTVGAGDES